MWAFLLVAGGMLALLGSLVGFRLLLPLRLGLAPTAGIWITLSCWPGCRWRCWPCAGTCSRRASWTA